MGEEFDADRIGRRDVGVVADLTGGGGVDIDIDIDIKVEVKVLSFLVVADLTGEGELILILRRKCST